MGCLPSKKEPSDLHPNVFRVVNIDENGGDLCSGQLEITESDIILYREGRDSTVWPLHSLRRYGFEGEIFSFESGRRCETGEGIYAFRCRRASLLFRTLQQQIQIRNVAHDSVPYPVSRMTPSPQGRQTLQASVVHRSSVDNGQPLSDTMRQVMNNNISAMVQNAAAQRNPTPRSPSSVDILEVMPLPQNNSSHATNVYQLRDFKKEHNNNNQVEATTETRHVYSNDLTRDLAILRNTLRQETVLNTIRDLEDESRFLENRYVNDSVTSNKAKSPLSPTLSSNSEHYAQLSLEQQEQKHEEMQDHEQPLDLKPDQKQEIQQPARLYMNIGINETKISEINKNEIPPTTPPTPTPKLVEYCNLSIGFKPEIITYANLALGEHGDNVRNVKHGFNFSATSEHSQKFSESDTFTSLSPVEELEVNYAILDMDTNKDIFRSALEMTSPESQSYSSLKNESITSYSSQTRGHLVSQCSVDKTASGISNIPPANIGYTTIDFDKTVALTSVAAGTDMDTDGPRRTRHNSCNFICTSPGCGDKHKTFL